MILLRDDDPNATTDPERLARAYAPLLDAGLQVNFSVVARVALDTRAPDGSRERFLDEGSTDCADEIALTPDTPLVRWLRAHDRDVDVLVHGLSHRRLAGGTEFGGLTELEARARIGDANRIFKNALGRVPVGFVPPWDRMSRGSLVAAAEAFAIISTGWVGRRALPLDAWPSHAVDRVTHRERVRVRGASVLRHRGGKITAEMRPEDVVKMVAELTDGADVGVIVLHHWMFWGGTSPHPVIRALAAALAGRKVVSAREAARGLPGRASVSPQAPRTRTSPPAR